MTKFEQALETCEKILTGVELGTMSTSSMLMMCLRVARLTNDEDAITWLQYENSGYPEDENGFIFANAWKVGWKHGRGSYDKEKKKETPDSGHNSCIFTKLYFHISYVGMSGDFLFTFGVCGIQWI